MVHNFKNVQERERERENINADLTITKEFRVEQYGIKN